MKASCLIIDDEPLAIQLLQKYVLECNELDLKGSCNNALEANQLLREQSIDLIFLDIRMPKLSGLELLQLLNPAPAVILTTAYREYALDGYEWDVVDYLLKPISFTRFLKAVEKFHKRRSSNSTIPSIPSEPSGWLLLQSGTKTHRIAEDEIIYIESLKDYICLYLKQGKKNLIKYQIGKLEKVLSGKFVRIHRSYIVNKDQISLLQQQTVTLINDQINLPIGLHYREALMKALEP